VSLTAELVTAKCTYGPDGITAESALSNVDIKTLAGLKKQLVSASAKSGVAVEPNTEIDVLGLGKVVLNEQIKSDKGMVVNAVHVYLTPKLKLLYGDIIVSQATCYKGAHNDPTASPSAPGDDPDPSASATGPGEPTDPNPTDTATSPDDGGLPNTGFKLATFASLGLVLVAAGAGAIWFARRRRATTDAS
ncbi:MAG: choice-of-anchor P family protein, partial [Micromonosporaceae bacterium]